MDASLRYLSPTLIHEDGGGFVCIWRREDAASSARAGTVGEWLSIPAHQHGEWLINGGWGGPPGPITVRWDEATQAWQNLGFPKHL